MNGNIATVLINVKHPKYNMFIRKLKRNIYHTIVELDAKVTVSKEPIGYNDRKLCKYDIITSGMGWGGFFDCGWFNLTGKLPPNIDRKDLVAILDLGGEGCVYNDDGVVQGITNVLGLVDKFQSIDGKKVIEIDKLNIDRDGNIDIWVEVGNNGRNHHELGLAKYIKSNISIIRREILDYYYDILSLVQSIEVVEDDEIVNKIRTALNESIKLAKNLESIDIIKARESLKKVMTDKKSDFTVYAVGHAHLDLAWLWPIRETKRKAERTFSNALTNIEKYPNYVFGASQPQQFEWIKDNKPTLYDKIKLAEKEGRLEVQGAMWVEPDTNLPCGESLIRQCLYGKGYFKEEFDQDINILWVPDVFGYSGALPQILKKCGVDYFMTIKLSWNNVNKFPNNTFFWEGIDRSRILVHMPPEGDYNSNGNPYAVVKVRKSYSEKDISKIALMPYGIGDGGAGPGEYHINMVDRSSKIIGLPNVKMAKSNEFFQALSQENAKFPTYQGELYLEKHQGTYTSQGKIKKFNRLMEHKLHIAEWLATMASLDGYAYPHELLDKLWKETLLYQFHDILPGSSINRVYKECYERYPLMIEQIDAIISSSTDRLNIMDKKYIVNPTPFDRQGYLEIGKKLFRYKTLAYSSGTLEAVTEQLDLRYGENYIENDNLKVVFNHNGDILNIYNIKDNMRPCLIDNTCGLRIYKDKRLIPYNAWDIDMNYYKKHNSRLKLIDSKTFIEGATVIRENIFKYNNSILMQRIILIKGCEYLKFDVTVDWQERHKMLRFDCYPINYSDTVKCDIQFGSINRSTRSDNTFNKAQFEISAHKWVDVSDGKYGIALLNDCKYGHRVKDGVISLNLLRSTVYPDKTADRGEHSFSYAIYPHRGEVKDSSVIEYGYELNYPLNIISNMQIEPIAIINNKNIIIESIFTNWNNDIILRLYESIGESAKTNLAINIDYESISEADMLYNNPQSIDINNIKFKPFEIKTLVIKRSTI